MNSETDLEYPQSNQEADVDITGVDDLSANWDKTFSDFGMESEIVAAPADKGITHPFPIQALTLPVVIEHHDIIDQAKTGTGKTLGFTIPILHDITGPGDEGWDELLPPGVSQALVLLPTHELAKQIAAEIRTVVSHRIARIFEIYGGVGFDSRIQSLKDGAEIVVGIPGCLIDLMKHDELQLKEVRTLVSDEADKMLDMGLLPDVEILIAATPSERCTMLLSATVLGPVVALARRYAYQPTHIRAADPSNDSKTVHQVYQFVYRIHSMNKEEVIARTLQAKDRGLTITFTRTKRSCQRLADELTNQGFAAGAIHGDLNQSVRERVLRAFRHGKVDMLVVTDVAARGTDVDDVTHVINLEYPEDEKTYIHRIGRTARAGHPGTAVTFVDWESATRWRVINRALELGLENPTETYRTSAHLYADLNILIDIPGYPPRSLRKRTGSNAEALGDLGGDSLDVSRNRRCHKNRDYHKNRERPTGRNAKSSYRAKDLGKKDGAKECSKKGEAKKHRKRKRTRRSHQGED